MRNLQGIWVGTLTLPGAAELRLGITIKTSQAGDMQAWLRIIDQHTGDISCSSVTADEEHIHLTIADLGIQIAGRLDMAGETLHAEFMQHESRFTLDFMRVAQMPEVKRPQEPARPFPYLDEEVCFDNEGAGVTLCGTFTYPKVGGPFPAVILLTGSGKLDRDESAYGHKPFLVLADFLTRQGIAVLRADDRGVGGSSITGNEATTGDFADDALAGIRYLHTRHEVNPWQIGLVGHSEGALKAAIAADRSRDVQFIVQMAGSGARFSEVMVHQILEHMRLQGVSAERIEKQKAWRQALYALFKPGRTAAAIEKDMHALFDALSDADKDLLGWDAVRFATEIKRSLSPWWQFMLSVDPADVLSRVNVPVLVMNGDKDTQNPADMNVPLLQHALSTGSSPNYLVKVLPGLNHMFQQAETGSEYEYGGIEETIAQQAMVLIAEWIWGLQSA